MKGGGLLAVMKNRSDVNALRAQMEQDITWLRQVIGDTRLAVPDRAAVQAKIAALVKRAARSIAAP